MTDPTTLSALRAEAIDKRDEADDAVRRLTDALASARISRDDAIEILQAAIDRLRFGGAPVVQTLQELRAGLAAWLTQ